ncbi:hypothetical protein AQF52_1785 [Streptomyces venezuelae]|uniref:DUF952 domain-containing protein n=1 Tax=Streptomyces gardneri TaxID=66892 RepID=UPI0006BC789F|nr:DUF952 domain-containing protein [Streptomyces gardneri]ALO07381.1 hypothetical protein AQF52_1785 [Streptomyces venezuelae]QPK44713.1 DUF952 domain-containing protein [Streptomyces gardneri]WRK36021.1 DUF952 domain-containing protein [Streptomyces venezuelae]CUM42304.1 hypothetical protein BN2537_13573 [Streptomyces venezuelae]
MLLHVVPLADWSADPADPTAPYAPASLAAEGFVHCSADEPAALAIADGPYRSVPGPLLVLVIDEARLGGEVRWEGAEGRLYPHVYGAIERASVREVLEVRRDADGRARELTPRP